MQIEDRKNNVTEKEKKNLKKVAVSDHNFIP